MQLTFDDNNSIGGALGVKNIKQEVFPEMDLDLIIVAVPYPGATPMKWKNLSFYRLRILLADNWNKKN
ncbi:MAG: hypothetical protein CM1200mP30_18570 [Pseudomonadota bacterium]|nr:MAG: hypothetical protein CM1200mP30_18570 [Pseudomonadota bacterium]